MADATVILIIGLLSQACYGARQLVQWIMTERYKRVVSPTGYWAFSLVGCCFMLIYGWLREDLVILLGQTASFFVYVLNLIYKGAWRRLPKALRVALYTVPAVALVATLVNAPHLLDRFIHNPDIPLGLMIYGTLGQMVYLSRYAFQVYISVKHGESLLPPVFWAISIVGSLLILVYGIIRRDVVLILGQSAGIAIYARNFYIGTKLNRLNRQTETT